LDSPLTRTSNGSIPPRLSTIQKWGPETRGNLKDFHCSHARMTFRGTCTAAKKTVWDQKKKKRRGKLSAGANETKDGGSSE